MERIWTRHRFSGEALALDVANTVVMRMDPARSFDRFDHPEEIVRFAAAASRFRTREVGGGELSVADPVEAKPRLIALREATDALFRDASLSGGTLRADLLSPLLERCADGLRGGTALLAADGTIAPPMPARVELEAAVAASAISLLAPQARGRIRICGNCGWLFVDRSRNGSRVWCDMSVCGNRQKARRHYRRTQAAAETENA